MAIKKIAAAPKKMKTNKAKEDVAETATADPTTASGNPRRTKNLVKEPPKAGLSAYKKYLALKVKEQEVKDEAQTLLNSLYGSFGRDPGGFSFYDEEGTLRTIMPRGETYFVRGELHFSEEGLAARAAAAANRKPRKAAKKAAKPAKAEKKVAKKAPKKISKKKKAAEELGPCPSSSSYVRSTDSLGQSPSLQVTE